MPITIEGISANPDWTELQVSLEMKHGPVGPSLRPLERYPMDNVIRLFQAFVAPAIFVSAISLLVLSVNVRLMGIVSRLRQYNRAKYKALRESYTDEAEVYTSQITYIEFRAEKIRRCFLFSLVSLGGAISSCLLLGLGLYWKEAAFAAAGIFVASLILLLIGVAYYIAEVTTALTAVKNESRDPRFGAPPETTGQDAI
jgi:hypothetical protein